MLGWQLGVARVIAAVVMAIILGLTMALIFRAHDGTTTHNIDGCSQETKDGTEKKWPSISVFILLVALLVIATMAVSWVIKLSLVSLLVIIIATLLVLYFSKQQVQMWGNQTWFLARRIFPLLLGGVFFVGLLGGVAALYVDAPADESVGVLVKDYIGGNSLTSCFTAAVIGAVLYMPTLLEVPIVNDLFGFESNIMGAGPALALLLAGPSLSLPNMIVIVRVMGGKKSSVYILLVVCISTLIGFLYGWIT
jgi:uncharacterized membrane protein YraQ (UPF0718 family)